MLRMCSMIVEENMSATLQHINGNADTIVKKK
jgi:hypothetical protein